MSETVNRKNRAAGSRVDPMSLDISDKISSYINRCHAATMLLIAWNIAKRRDTIVAQLMSVDRLGFDLRQKKL